VRIQVALLWTEEKRTEEAYSFWKTSEHEKMELFQMIIDPPEAPLEGRNSN
jgi:hypothetical protein